MIRRKMVLIITTALVHLVVIGSGTLLARWRTEEQVLEEKDMPEMTFSRRTGRAKRAIDKLVKGVKTARQRRSKRRAEKGGSTAKDDAEAAAAAAYLSSVNTRSTVVVQRRRRARGAHASVNVLILMSDTGGGHRASAQALEAAFDQIYPGAVAVTMVDIWTEHSTWPTSRSVAAYQYAAKNPVVWRTMYEYMRFPPTRWLSDKVIAFRNFRAFTAAIEQYQPDLVISVHPLCQDLPLKVLAAIGPGGQRELPFVTVVTDLAGAHPTWFDPDADKVFIASEAVMRVAFREKVDGARIRQLGLPIRPAFWLEARPRDQLRVELGLDPEAPAALVVGGGDGVGGLAAVARAVIAELGRQIKPMQVIVVCGKNAVVRRELEDLPRPRSLRVVVHGFVKNMDEWMAAVDCIVTKAGPGTIAEATIRGLPVMLSGFLPGQEEGNVRYVKEGGFGTYDKNPNVIGRTVAEWLSRPEELARMSAAARAAARPDATYRIAEEIADMMFSPTGMALAAAEFAAKEAADTAAAGAGALDGGSSGINGGGGSVDSGVIFGNGRGMVIIGADGEMGVEGAILEHASLGVEPETLEAVHAG